MAFVGVLIFNVILFIIFCSAALGAACLVAALILAILQFIRKWNGKINKKWLRTLPFILAIIGLLSILPFLILLIIGA